MFRYALGIKRSWPRDRYAPFAFANLGATTLEAESFRSPRSSQPTIGVGGGTWVHLGRRLSLSVGGEYFAFHIADTDDDFPACRIFTCERSRSTELWGQFQLRVGFRYGFGR